MNKKKEQVSISILLYSSYDESLAREFFPKWGKPKR